METNTTPKLAVGQLIIAALIAVTSKLTKAARDTFTKVFTALTQAEEAVKTADALVEDVTQRCQAADDAQGRATLELATKMSGDGFGRLNPFKAFSVVNPSKVRSLGHSNEADVLIGLAARVRVHHQSSTATKKAAVDVERTAKAMKAVDAERLKALDKRAAAVKHRDGLHSSYAAALTNLRSSIKYADYAEQTSHYLNVFPRVVRPKKKQSTPAPVG